MADSSVAVTPGTGANVDTFTQPSGDHRQAVVIGDPAAANAASVDAVGRLNVNLGGSGGLSPSGANSLTAAGASGTGSASSTSASLLDVSSAGNCSFHLLATAFVGTVVFEQSFDSAGSAGTWAPVPIMPEDGTAPITTLSINTGAAYIRQFTVPMFGPSLFRVRCSAFTSGTLVTLMKAGPGWYESQPSLAQGVQNIGRVDLACADAGTTTSVSTNATANTSQQLLAADSTRKSIVIQNVSAGTVYINCGATAVTASLFTYKITPGNGVEILPQFAKLAIQGMCTVASGAVAITVGTGV